MVAIKDMEMPESCIDCPLTYPRWDFDIGCKCCKAIIGHHEEYGEYKTTRHLDCPLVEIVTCKDCRSECTEKNGEKFSETRPDFFCADAERKE